MRLAGLHIAAHRLPLWAVAGLMSTLGAASPVAAAWHAPVVISGHGEFSRVELAANGRGDAIAVWSRVTQRTSMGHAFSKTTYAIQAAFRPAGRGWQKPVTIGSTRAYRILLNAEGPAEALVAIDPRGQAIVAWVDPNLDQSVVNPSAAFRTVVRAANGRWEKPVVLSDTSGTADVGMVQPQVALDQRGNATAIWSEHGQLLTAFKPAGSAWRRPDTIGSGAYNGTQLALDAGGDAMLILTNRIGSSTDYQVQSVLRPAGGAWSEPITVGIGNGSPQLAVNPHGDAIVVWAAAANPPVCCFSSIQASFRPAGGSWTTPNTVQTSRGWPALQVALDRRANATIMWAYNEYPWAVQSAFKPAQGSWHRPATLARTATSTLKLAVDRQGDALAAWDTAAYSGAIPTDVRVAFRSPQGVWRKPHRIAFGGFPDAGFDSQGNAVAVWIDDQSIVKAAVFTRAP